MLDNKLKFTIHSHFVVPALRAAEKRGTALGSFLQGTGVSPEMLRDPQVRFTIDQYNAVTKRLWLTLDDENTGLLPRRIRMGTFRALCELAMNAEDIGGVFRNLVRAYTLFVSYMRVSHEVERGESVFSFNLLGFEDDSHVLTEWTLLSWHRFACWLSGRSFPLTRVAFRYDRPDYAEEYAKLFGCECVYRCERQELAFDAHFLKLPVIRTWRDLGDFVRNSPGIFLALPSVDDDIVLQVRRLLLSRGEKELVFPSFEVVARGLDMTGQTLRRRLRAGGTSYQKIKDGIRRDTAIELLADAKRTIAEIAELVGFRETSGFSRAFKEWTGVSPNVYRAGSRLENPGYL